MFAVFAGCPRLVGSGQVPGVVAARRFGTTMKSGCLYVEPGKHVLHILLNVDGSGDSRSDHKQRLFICAVCARMLGACGIRVTICRTFNPVQFLSGVDQAFTAIRSRTASTGSERRSSKKMCHCGDQRRRLLVRERVVGIANLYPNRFGKRFCKNLSVCSSRSESACEG